MKIAFVIFSLSNQSGGTTTSLLNLYKSLSQTVEIDIYAGHKPHETVYHAFLNKENIFVFEATTSWWYCPELKDRLIEKINGYDLVHIHGIWTYPSYIASKLALQFNKPYIISTHGMLESYAFQTKRWKKSPYWYLFQKNLLLKASSIHTISFLETQNAQKMLPSSHICQIPNGVDLSRKDIKKKSEKKIIGFIGRFHPIKAIDKLIDAFGKLNSPYNEIELHLAGSGEKQYEKYIDNLIEQCPNRDNIKLLGFLNDTKKEQFYDNISILALTSHSEGLSMVMLEALSRGIPCLITKQCSFDDVENYDTGLIIENNEAFNIKKGIESIFNKNLEVMSKNAQNLIMEKYSLDVIGNQMLSYYKEIIYT